MSPIETASFVPMLAQQGIAFIALLFVIGLLWMLYRQRDDDYRELNKIYRDTLRDIAKLEPESIAVNGDTK